jgi:GTPase KRas protein
MIEIDDKNAYITITDSAIESDYIDTSEKFYTKGDIFIIIYSIDNRISFENLTYYIDRVIKEKKCCHCIIVGNKIDLSEEKRSVSYEEGLEFAKKYGLLFFETSIYTRLNIDEIFIESVKLYRNMNNNKNNNNNKKDCLIS